MTVAPDQPDWSAITMRIACPVCDYELRGLVEPRCPECGYQFDWKRMLDPAEQKHPFLFEHHPEKNIASFVRTKLAGFAPWKFWQKLRPDQVSKPRRLLLYWLISSMLLLIAPVGDFGRYCYQRAQTDAPLRARVFRSFRNAGMSATTAQGQVDQLLPKPWSENFWTSCRVNYLKTLIGTPKLALALVYLAWPWLTFAALMVFQISMRRARVRPIHVLRCAIYSCDVSLLVALALIIVVPQSAYPRFGTLIGPTMAFSREFIALAWGACAFALLTLAKLYPAYRLYLPFPHPFATTLASQTMVALGLLALTAVVFG